MLHVRVIGENEHKLNVDLNFKLPRLCETIWPSANAYRTVNTLQCVYAYVVHVNYSSINKLRLSTIERQQASTRAEKNSNCYSYLTAKFFALLSCLNLLMAFLAYFFLSVMRLLVCSFDCLGHHFLKGLRFCCYFFLFLWWSSFSRK